MNNRNSRNAAIFGVILITIGVLSLVGQFAWQSPLLSVAITLVIGLIFFAGAYASGRTLSILAIPGVVLVVVALFQLVNLYFPDFYSEVYAWTLVIPAIGLGMAAFGHLTGSKDLEHGGWGVAHAGLVLFLFVGIATELFFTFTGGSSGPRAVVWPLILILVGLVTLIVRLVRLAQAGALLGGLPPADEFPEPEPAVETDENAPDAISRAEERARRAVRRAQRQAEHAQTRNTDLFSPVVWMGFGVLWLELSVRMISMGSLISLLNLWPVLLVFAGINIIFGRRIPLVKLVLALALVSGAFYAVANADRLGLSNRAPWLVFGINHNQDIGILQHVNGSGTVTSETRPVSGFQDIVVNGAGDVSIVSGDSPSLVIEADDNLLPYLTSEVRDGQLRLGVKTGVSIAPTRLHYTITLAQLDGLIVNGAASVKSGPLGGDDLSVRISGLATVELLDLEYKTISANLSGSGTITLSGSADQLHTQISGAGSLNAGDLRTAQSLVQISGVGQATIWATEELNSNISGLGSVSYYGDPAIHKTTGGLGLIRKIGDK